MQKIKYLVSFLSVMIVFIGCSGKVTNKEQYESQAVSRDIFAMDTYMTLTAYGEGADEALDSAVLEIQRLESLFSTEKAGSEIYEINHGDTESLSEETLDVLERSMEIYESTNGLFDITIYPLIKEWGFTTKEYQVPEKETIEELLSYVDASKVELAKDRGEISLPTNVQIDLGGIAKGYTSQRIMDIFEENGVESGLVSLGGNVQCYGEKPDGSKWKIGIKNPDKSQEYIGIVEVSDKAVVTSGGYERYFEENGERYHHILNPKTGYPAESGFASVSVISKDGTLADALSTALFVMGKEEALNYWREHDDQFDMVLVEENGKITITEGIETRFSSDNSYEIEKKSK